jgi:hypothetical protein
VPPPDGPTPKLDESPASFFDAPWPSDRRVDADGTLALADFPNPTGSALLDTWLAFGEQQVGFGTNSPIYVDFDAPLDLARLPSPAESVGEDSPIVLVDVDPKSPWRNERVPVTWEWFDQLTAYIPENLLAVAPVPGFPLHGSTEYALLVTTAIASPSPAMGDLWGSPGYADLVESLAFLHLARADVAGATVFTTTDPVGEMGRVADFLREKVDPPNLSLALEPVYGTDYYDVYAGHYPGPRLTHGVRPYLDDGGQFEFAADGDPILDGWDDMRIAVCVPKDVSHPPVGGWPVAINQHGTGGDFLSHCSPYNDPSEVAARLSAVGIVTVGIDQPLNGTRTGGSYSDLANFNVLNPDSGVSNFRQGAADAIYLAHALASARTVMTLPDGTPLPLDPDRVLFLGHSQGGLTGAIASPFFGSDVKGEVFSGTGGVLAITLQVRKDPVDFAVVFSSLLGFGEDDVVTPMHPTMALLQTFAERTDPINYAPYWFFERGDWGAQAPTPTLLTSGTADTETPYQTALALGSAGRMPILAPAATETEAHDLRGLPTWATDLEGDVATYDGSAVTAGMAQFRDGSHFVIWESDEAGDLYQSFLASVAAGGPALDRP